MRRLRVLHISDLHERAPFAGMPEARLKRIASDARQRGQILGPRFKEALQSLAPQGVDLVCFTGDLADWGHPAEYEKATQRIDDILQRMGVPRSRFFAVPGNHDVQRQISQAAWLGLRSWLAQTQDVGRLGRWLAGDQGPPPGTQAEWLAQVQQRTVAFWDWLAAFRGDDVRAASGQALGYRSSLAAGSLDGIDVPVHVVGLDSAWLCGPEMSHDGGVLKDQGSIVVTQQQVDSHIREGEHALGGYRLALVHHPLDHLADHAEIRGLLGDDGVDLLLHGHQHVPLSLQSREPGSTLRVLAAGCLVEGDLGRDWPNGFQLLALDPVSGAGNVTFRKWSARSRFWAKGSDIYREAPDGVLAFEGDDPPAAAPSPGPAPGAIPPLVLRLDTPRLVDLGSLKSALRQYGREWPTTTIQWPASLELLIAGLKAGLHGPLHEAGGDDFAAAVPKALQAAEEGRERVAAHLPGLVRRARELPDELLLVLLKNVLLVSNYYLHRELAYHSCWQGLAPWETPPDWRSFRADQSLRAFGSLLGEVVTGRRLPSGRLIEAEGCKIYTDGGSPGLYIHAPRQILKGPRPIEICEWFIPQLEYRMPEAALPVLYRLEGWHVDKIILENGDKEHV